MLILTQINSNFLIFFQFYTSETIFKVGKTCEKIISMSNISSKNSLYKKQYLIKWEKKKIENKAPIKIW